MTDFIARPALTSRLAPLLLVLSLGVAAASVSAQIIETVAGGGIGDGGPATAAPMNSAHGVAVGSSGDLYIVDLSNNRIRKVTVATGAITTVAVTGFAGYNGDNVAATSAMLNQPVAVAVDSSSNLYIVEQRNNRIRKVTAATGIISTVAGTGLEGYNGDNITATSAMLNSPTGVAVDASGNLYIADYNNRRVRKVTVATGVINTVAGNGLAGGYNDDNIAATSAALYQPLGVAVDSSGNLYIVDYFGHRIRKVTVATGIITTVAGGAGTYYLYNGDNIAATSASLYKPTAVAVDTSGNLYIADFNNQRIRKVKAATGIITTVAGNGTFGYNGDNIDATSASLFFPIGVAVDLSGNLYIADEENQRVRKVTVATGIITTVAGIGSFGYNGDNIAANTAVLNDPEDVAIDAAGNLYIADQANHRVRKVSGSSGVINTVAGTGSTGYNGDNIAAASATLSYPAGVAVDSSGNLYIADAGNQRIRKVTAATGVITTVAGTGSPGYNGDNIAATGATLNIVSTTAIFFSPHGLAVDSAGNLYIADQGNQRVRKVNVATGVITTVAGTGSFGYNGDNIAATSANLYNPSAIAVDSSGNIYIADTSNQRIRKVAAATGIITTLAGTGSFGYSSDNIGATSALLSNPTGVAVDSSGNLYIADQGNKRVRKVTVGTGVITTVVGTGAYGQSGDGNAAASATLGIPTAVAVDLSGNLYVADRGSNRIRKMSTATGANYQGLWWNAPAGSESGWGINFAHQGSDVFATWFTYDASGKALWLSMTANRIGTDYIGTLYQTTGPVFSAMPFNPALVTRTAVGSGTLTFNDTNNASFAYIYNGTTQIKSITRQVFGPLPTCTFGAQTNLALVTNYQDLWWAAPGGTESGWGVNFSHQGDTIFATWFTYDVDGTPLWLSATAVRTVSGVYSGTLFRTTGPVFSAVPFVSANVTRAEVGTLTLNFASGNNAQFTYTAFGVTQSKSIARQVFNTPGTMCL